ncbi:DUF3331 domain-containing protein [Paraburkholderia fungorum]|uniref:DUF3331 domain-containing protein n=1 Tax=Paraburkholderia fungorum TaxID=134537 RepID=UPI00402BDF1E
MNKEAVETPAQAISLCRWTHVHGASDEVTPRPERCPVAHEQQEHGGPIVRVIDWVDVNTVILSWSDALSGHYGEQTWKKTRTKRAGRCALSGRWIARGEAVYRARARPRPRNADAMITAEILATFARGQIAAYARSTAETVPISSDPSNPHQDEECF